MAFERQGIWVSSLEKHGVNEALYVGRTILERLLSRLAAVPQPGIHEIRENVCHFGYTEAEKRFSNFATVVWI